MHIPTLESLSIVGLPEACALAATALIGYLWGQRHGRNRPHNEHMRQELLRASNIATTLQRITDTLRRDLAAHHANVVEFTKRVAELSDSERGEPWEELGHEAQAMLEPTLRFANQVSQAYDQLRQQSKELLIFADSHIDLATRLGNRRALEEQLNVMFETWDGDGPKFSVALFSIDAGEPEKSGEEEGDTELQQVAALAEKEVRSSDFVARYGQHEIIALLPRTGLAGATIFANRFRCQVERSTPTTLSGGVTEVMVGDTAKELLARADSALYSARAEGKNCLFQHNGAHIRQFDTASVSSEPTLSGQVAAADELPSPPPEAVQSAAAVECGNTV